MTFIFTILHIHMMLKSLTSFSTVSNNETIYKEIKYNTKDGRSKKVKETEFKNFDDIKYANFEFLICPCCFCKL